MIKMNEMNENISAYTVFVIYVIVGALLRYEIIPPCDPVLENLRVAMGYNAIPYIIIGIGAGLYSFIFPKMKLARVALGIVTGLSVGFGGMTVYALALNPCI